MHLVEIFKGRKYVKQLEVSFKLKKIQNQRIIEKMIIFLVAVQSVILTIQSRRIEIL